MKTAGTIIRKHILLSALSLALLPLAAGAQAQSQARSGAASGEGKITYSPATAFVVVPLASPVQDEWMKTGCWAKLHDIPNFLGDTLTLAGPVDMPDMTGPFGIDWKGKISSIQTGAKATLVIYDNENYRDPVSTIMPGQRVADVSKRIGFFDEMSSLRITCDGMTTK